MPPPKEQCKVLCLDDDLVLAELCEERSRDLGYEVVAESDPEKALQIFNENPEEFHLLIVDYVMPKMHGVEFAKRIRAIRSDIHVLLVTGRLEGVSEETVREAGIKEVLLKPLTRAELEAAIDRALNSVSD